MAGRRAARAGSRGGAVIPALRSTTIRLIIGAAAVTLEAAIAIWVTWRAPLLANLIGLLAVLAEMLLIGGLLSRQPAPLAWSIVLVGTAYGLSLVGQRESVDATGLLVAAVLFLAAEVAYLGVDPEAFSGLPIRPLAAAIAVALGSVVISVLLLAIGESALAGGPLLMAGGIAAALILLGVVLATAARRAHAGGATTSTTPDRIGGQRG